MPVRDIRARIGVDGEKEFSAAMAEAARNMKNMDAEMRKASAAYDLSGDKAAYLAEKSRLLGDKMQQQEEIVAGLKHQLEQAADKYGETGSQTDKFRQKLTRAETEMLKLQKATQDADQDLEELGRDSTRIGRQLESGIGDAADDISDKLERMTRQVEKDLSDIGGAVQFSALKDAGEMMAGAFEQFTGFVEGNVNIQRQLSYLEQNALEKGFAFEHVKALLIQITGITGDLDGAFEGINNLLASGFDGKELSEAIELIGGAVIRFPETMKFENLAESLQESIAGKSATGAYAELLSRLEVDLEVVNKALEKAKTAEAAQQVALSFLNEHGLEGSLKGYQDANKDMTDFYAQQTEFTLAQAALAKELTPAATAAMELATTMIEKATEATIEAKELWEKYQQSEAQAEERMGETTAEDSEYKKISDDIVAKIQMLQEAGNQLAAQNMAFIQQQLDTVTSEYVFGVIDEEAYKAKLDELGKAAATSFLNGMDATISSDSQRVEASAETVGGNMAISVGNGISRNSQSAVNAASSLWDSINAVMNRVISVPVVDLNTYNGTGKTTASSYAAGGQNNTVTVITQVDGNTVGKATADSVSGVQGQQAQRASMYNR